MNDADSCRCDDMAARILRFCEAHDVKIVAAESLTGGLLADAFVRVPGASRVFLGSAVTYDIRAKTSILGVDRGLLEREGAVHPEVARQMAASVAGLYGQPEYADRVIGLSTTGVSLGYLSEVERGQKEASSELLSSIAGSLGVSTAQMLRLVADYLDSISE